MKNDVELYYFNKNQVRTVIIENEPWFVAKDVCDILELQNSSRDVQRLDEDEKLLYILCIAGQNRGTWIVNESGLYSLILTSRKQEAKNFQKWVTSEVLPSIRKTGKYDISHIVKLVGDSKKARRELTDVWSDCNINYAELTVTEYIALFSDSKIRKDMLTENDILRLEAVDKLITVAIRQGKVNKDTKMNTFSIKDIIFRLGNSIKEVMGKSDIEKDGIKYKEMKQITLKNNKKKHKKIKHISKPITNNNFFISK